MNADFKLEPLMGEYQLIGDSQLLRLSEKFLNYPRRDGRIGLCISGQTISELLVAIAQNTYPVSSKIICLIGTNDLMRKIPVNAMVSSMEALVRLLLYDRAVEKLILLTVPPVPRLAIYSYHWSRLKDFNNYLLTLSDGNRIIVYEIHELFMCENNRAPRRNSSVSSFCQPRLQTPSQDRILLNQAELLFPKFEKVKKPSFVGSAGQSTDSLCGPSTKDSYPESHSKKDPPIFDKSDDPELSKIRSILFPNKIENQPIEKSEIKLKKEEDLVRPELLKPDNLFSRRSDFQSKLSTQAASELENPTNVALERKWPNSSDSAQSAQTKFSNSSSHESNTQQAAKASASNQLPNATQNSKPELKSEEANSSKYKFDPIKTASSLKSPKKKQSHDKSVASSLKLDELDGLSFEERKHQQRQSLTVLPKQKSDQQCNDKKTDEMKSEIDLVESPCAEESRSVEGMESNVEKSSFTVTGKPAEKQTKPIKLYRSPLNVMMNHLNLVKLPKPNPDICTPIPLSEIPVQTAEISDLSDKGNSFTKDTQSDSSGDSYTKDPKILKVEEELGTPDHFAASKPKGVKKSKTTKVRVRKQAGQSDTKTIFKENISHSNEQGIKEESIFATTSVAHDPHIEQQDSSRSEAPLSKEPERKVYMSKRTPDGGHEPIHSDQKDMRVYGRGRGLIKKNQIISPPRCSNPINENVCSNVIRSPENPSSLYVTSMDGRFHREETNSPNTLSPSHHLDRELSVGGNPVFVHREPTHDNAPERRVFNSKSRSPVHPLPNHDHLFERNVYSSANCAIGSTLLSSNNQLDERRVIPSNCSPSREPFFDHQANVWVYPTVASPESVSNISPSRNNLAASPQTVNVNYSNDGRNNYPSQEPISRKFERLQYQDGSRIFERDGKHISTLEPQHNNQAKERFHPVAHPSASGVHPQYAQKPANRVSNIVGPVMRSEPFNSNRPLPMNQAVYNQMNLRVQSEYNHPPQYQDHALNVRPFPSNLGSSNFNETSGSSSQRYCPAPEPSQGNYQEIPMTFNLFQHVNSTVNNVSPPSGLKPQRPALQHAPIELAYRQNLIYVNNNKPAPAYSLPEAERNSDVYRPVQMSRNTAPHIPSNYTDFTIPSPIAHSSPTQVNMLRLEAQNSCVSPINVPQSQAEFQYVQKTPSPESHVRTYNNVNSRELSKDQGTVGRQFLEEGFVRSVQMNVSDRYQCQNIQNIPLPDYNARTVNEANSAELNKDQGISERQYLKGGFERNVHIDESNSYEFQNIQNIPLPDYNAVTFKTVNAAEISKNQSISERQFLRAGFERNVHIDVSDVDEFQSIHERPSPESDARTYKKVNLSERIKDQDTSERLYLKEGFERSVHIDAPDPCEKNDSDDESLYESCAGDLSQDSLCSTQTKASLFVSRNDENIRRDSHLESSAVRDCVNVYRNQEEDQPSLETSAQPIDSFVSFKKPEIIRQKYNNQRIVRLEKRSVGCYPIICQDEDNETSKSHHLRDKQSNSGYQEHSDNDQINVPENNPSKQNDEKIPVHDDNQRREQEEVRKERIVRNDDSSDELPRIRQKHVKEGAAKHEKSVEDFEDISDEDFDFQETHVKNSKRKKSSLEGRGSKTERFSGRAREQTPSIRTSNRFSALSTESYQGSENLNWRTRSQSRCSSSSEDTPTRNTDYRRRPRKSRFNDITPEDLERHNAQMRSRSTPRTGQWKGRDYSRSRNSSPAHSEERAQVFRHGYTYPEIRMDSFEEFFNPNQENPRKDLIHLNNKGLATVLNFLQEKLSQ